MSLQLSGKHVPINGAFDPTNGSFDGNLDDFL